MNAVSGGILALLGVLVGFAPRRWAALAMMAGVLYLTQGQHLNLGAHIYPMRLLGLIGFMRVMGRGEFSPARMNAVDKALVFAYAYAALVFLARSAVGYGTDASVAQVSNMDKIGGLLDAIFCFFSFRGMIASYDDFIWFIQRFSIVLIPYVALVFIERTTGQNPLAIVGGLSNLWVDGDRLRCRGSFRHPSLLGSLGASFLPIYIGLALTRNNKLYGWLGMVLCIAIVVLSESGGPANFAAVGILGWLMWGIRKHMGLVRRAILALLVALALVMKAPIWYLPDRLSAITGGDGWHRSFLMNQAFTNIDQWWLAGMPLDLTIGWFPYLAMGGADITNLYIAFGLDAGIVGIALFIRLLARAFGGLGQAMAALRPGAREPHDAEFMLWGLGAMLAGHLSNWIAITYFDQISVVWFMQIAVISGISWQYQTTAGRFVADPCAAAKPAIRYSIYRDEGLAHRHRRRMNVEPPGGLVEL